LTQTYSPKVLVGFETSDDAGVYKLNAEQAIVTTADFITPPVDDPYLFGQVAAANSLSDIYAMGGTPLTCINLVAFPSDKLESDVLQDILAGAQSKISEAEAFLVGGHSTEDEEPKFGLAVTGVVHPNRIWRNSTAQVGDQLILTKPLGSGVLFNANLKGWVSRQAMDECLNTLITLNKKAAAILSAFDVHAATDVTGFGMAGHSLEMARGAGHTFEIQIDQLPVMREALSMYERGMTTGVNTANRMLVGKDTRFVQDIPPWHQEIVMDPQTSGGLLVAVEPGQAEAALDLLRKGGNIDAAIIGKVKVYDRFHLEFV
jgi:selenide,water dikinase